MKRKDQTMIGVALLAVAGAWLLVAWSYMLIAGIAHDSWWHQVPPMGFKTALQVSGIVVLMTTLGSTIKAVFARE